MNTSIETLDGVRTITITRPEKRNALTAVMYRELVTALRDADADRSVRAIVLTGAGGHFTAGNDLADFLGTSAAPPKGDWSEPPPSFMKALIDCEKPVVAAVTGTAVGIGATLLLHCDLVVLADDARITMPFVNLGLCPEFASSLLLPLWLGRARAAEILLLGAPIAPQELLQAGLANAVLPAADVLPRALALAGRFRSLAPQAVRASKRLMRQNLNPQVLAAVATENELFARRLLQPEAREAMQAFLEKRPPDFNRL